MLLHGLNFQSFENRNDKENFMYLYTYENLKKATECKDGKTFVDKIKEFYVDKYQDKPILA